MLVYRVQDESGFGPYNSGHDVFCWFSPSSQPVPYEDGIDDYGCDDRFGFESVRQLACWFHVRDREQLDTHFFVVEYDVHEDYVIKGRNQLVFNITKATELRRVKPTLVRELVSQHVTV